MGNKFLIVNPIRADVVWESQGGRAEARRAGRAVSNPPRKGGGTQPAAVRSSTARTLDSVSLHSAAGAGCFYSF